MRRKGRYVRVSKEVKQNLCQRKLNAVGQMPFKWKALFILLFPEYNTPDGLTYIDNVVYKHTADAEVINKIEWLAGQIDSIRLKSYRAYRTKELAA